MIYTWFKIFYRSFKKKPLYPVINLLGLIAGLTCFLLAMLYVNHEFSYEQWNPEKERVYGSKIILQDGQVLSGVVGGLPNAATSVFPEVLDNMVYRDEYDVLIAHGENKFFEHHIKATDNYFDFFPYPFKYGNAVSVFSHESNIAISEELSNKFFGTADPIDKVVKFNNENAFTIKAVFQTDGLLSHTNDIQIISSIGDQHLKDDWGNFNYEAYYILEKGTDVEKLDDKYKAYYIEQGAKYANQTIKQYSKNYSADLELENLEDMHLFSKKQKGAGANTVFIVSLLSFLILLISAINFINLSITGATQRAKEVAVRKTLGAQKKSVVYQFVLEVILLFVISLFISLALVEILITPFGQLLDVELNMVNALQYLPILFVTTLILILLSGLFPAIYLSNFNPVSVLKGNFSRSKSGNNLKKVMIVIQFTISTVFLISAFIIYNQLKHMNQHDLGFDKDHVMMISVNDRLQAVQKLPYYRQEMMKIEGVKSICGTDKPPGTGNAWGSLSQVKYMGEVVGADIHFIDRQFIPNMGIDIVKGRNYLPTEDLSLEDNKILVNEKLVEMLKIEDPIGTKTSFWDIPCEIVGVVTNYITKGFDQEISPALYSLFEPIEEDFSYHPGPAVIMIKLDGQNLEQSKSAIEEFWTNKMEPGFPFEYDFLDDDFAELTIKYTRLQKLVFALSFIMILISLLGLFAVASYSIQQRNKEVAIRKTLGGSDRGIILNLIKEFVLICTIAILISLPIAFLLSSAWLEEFVYRIDMPIMPYIIAPLFILGLTVFIIWSQARATLKVDLVTWLGYE